MGTRTKPCSEDIVPCLAFTKGQFVLSASRFVWILVFALVLAGGVVRGWGQIGNASSSSATNTTMDPITVSGRVLNAVTGQPISRALVRVNNRAVLTTTEGKFQFDQYIGTGNALFQVTKPGYYLSPDPSEASTLTFTADQLADPIEIRLYPEALLAGTVTDPEGDPIPHIGVTARRSMFDGFAHHWVQGAMTQTDSHGNFRLPVPPGDYKIETMYQPRSAESGNAILPLSLPEHNATNTLNVIHVSSGEQLHFDLHPRTGRTYDVVLGIDGMPERGFPNLTARSSDGLIIPLGINHNGPSDEFRVQLPTGTFTLNVVVNGGPDSSSAYAQADITIPDHDISGVQLHLASNLGIPVELVIDPSVPETSSATSDNAKPPEVQQMGLTLLSTARDLDRGSEVVGLVPTKTHTFNFVVPPGVYRLQARIHGQWYIKAANYGTSDLLQQDLVIGPGSGGTPIRVTVSNQTSALQGTVRLNGKPGSCWLYVVPTGPSAEPQTFIRSSTSGSYTSTYLPPGGYQVIAFEHRYSADLREPETIGRFSTYVHSIILNPGDKPTLDLDAVPAAEMIP
jgi:Carboxypeptidase regulatory-like domain